MPDTSISTVYLDTCYHVCINDKDRSYTRGVGGGGGGGGAGVAVLLTKNGRGAGVRWGKIWILGGVPEKIGKKWGGGKEENCAG